ncbi:MAG: hypothetical protein ABFD92_21225 [Planctomycetaceae bacterium]
MEDVRVCKNPDCQSGGKPQPLSAFRKSGNKYRGKCKACETEYQRQYRTTDAGKKVYTGWNNSDKGKASIRRFDKSEKRRDSRLRYRTEYPDRWKEQYHRNNTSERARKYSKERQAKKEYQIIVAASAIVDAAILRGEIPTPKNLACLDCGKRAREYHHHNGYDDAHVLDVIPLCRSCHARRHVR